MKDFITVTTFTIKDMVKRKSFIISNIIFFSIIILLFNIPNIMKAINGGTIDDKTTMMIVDSENIFEGNLEQIKEIKEEYKFEIRNDNVNFDEIKEKINNGDLEEALVIESKDGKIMFDYIVENTVYVSEVPEELISIITGIYTNMQISKLGLTEEQLLSLVPSFEFNLKQTAEKEVQGNNLTMMILSMVLFFAIYFCACQVANSITIEKTSKIIETLVTSTTPKTIVLGKTAGIGIVGLLQVVATIAVVLISKNLFLEEGVFEAIINFDNITPFLIAMILVYFLLGYILYAVMYALTGSTVAKPEDVQSANMPVGIIAMIGFYLAYFTMINPTSELNALAGILPISSPFCMPFRIMMGIAEMKDIILSIGLLIITIAIVAKISIKIYSNAILNNGTKMSFKDVVKMYKIKND